MMTSAKSFLISSLVYLFSMQASIVCSKPQKPVEDIEAPPLSSRRNSSVKNENGTGPWSTDDSQDDFPALSFFLRDVLTTSLGVISNTGELRPNSSKLVDLDQLTDGSQNASNLSRLNYETLWHNGSLTLTLVDIQEGLQKHHDIWDDIPTFELEEDVEDFKLDDDDDVDMFDKTQSDEPHRRKRALFGSDDRIEVSADGARHLPYSAVVSVNTGCTGTLIAQDHVLTAAHCIHDGTKYITDVPHLKVGVLRRPRKPRWIRVDYMKVPRGWTLSRDFRYDYAVLKLRRPAPSPAQYLEMYEIPAHLSMPLRIQFASFPSDKPKFTLWYSYCKAHCLNHAILNRCDSNYGSSGAGIYGKIRKGRKVERFVMGVFSGLGNFVKFRGKRRRMNVGTKITPLKLAQIRAWLDASPPGNRDSPVIRAMPPSRNPPISRQ